MAMAQLTLESFYDPEVQAEQTAAHRFPARPGDGFTEEELADTLDPLHRSWNPEREYEEFAIGTLPAGPNAVTFCGRVANLQTVFGRTAKEPKARGWHHLILKDDSAAMSLKVFFSQKAYPLKIGDLLTFWTAFISVSGSPSKLDAVKTSASIFPGRVTSDHVMLHTNKGVQDLCRTPLGYVKGQSLQGLMTLESYMKGGHDGVRDIKLLVCVKSRAASRKVQKKDGSMKEVELMEVVTMDHTSEIRMTVWNDMIDSAKSWKIEETILLLYNPSFRMGYGGRGSITLSKQGMIDLDPRCEDAEWLRRWLRGRTKREASVITFPVGVWDCEAAEYGVVRMFFTLAEIDSWIRSDGHQVFTGFLNLTFMSMELTTIHKRGMLMCGSCCGNIVYSSCTSTMTCSTCSEGLSLTVNPKVVGLLMDETGSIAGGRLIWSARAWETLFGRPLDEIARMTSEQVTLFEQRVMYLRLHLCVGWAGEDFGRLAVLAVKM